MPSRAVLLLTIGVAASSLLGAEVTGAPDADGAQGGAAVSSKGGAKPPPEGGRARTPAKVQDQEIIDHLDEIEQLELLQYLDLFDTAAPKGK